jgi:microsomal dipeptidase-like Zn-dependent dipeptidase
MITALAVVERWPPRTWTSLRERALYQARKLQETAERSDGRLTLLRTRGDVTRYLERRRAQPAITAGLLAWKARTRWRATIASVDTLFEAGFRMIAPTHFFDDRVGRLGPRRDQGRAHGSRPRARAPPGAAPQSCSTSPTPHPAPSRTRWPWPGGRWWSRTTGVKGTCDNIRNLSDDELRGVAGTAG